MIWYFEKCKKMNQLFNLKKLICAGNQKNFLIFFCLHFSHLRSWFLLYVHKAYKRFELWHCTLYVTVLYTCIQVMETFIMIDIFIFTVASPYIFVTTKFFFDKHCNFCCCCGYRIVSTNILYSDIKCKFLYSLRFQMSRVTPTTAN